MLREKNSDHLQVMRLLKQLSQSVRHLTKPFSIQSTAFLLENRHINPSDMLHYLLTPHHTQQLW